nr:tripeptidyl-peptidase 2 [Solanum lycopersicum]
MVKHPIAPQNLFFIFSTIFVEGIFKHTKVEGAHLKMVREDLQNRVDLLRKQADSYDDKGPVIDAVVWHDGELWRAALDTQSLEDESGCGKLADFVPLTNYRLEQKHGVFSKLDACTCVLNVYNEGNILSIVTDSSPHATHVAGIAAAFHPEEPLLNGVAPGAQIVSCKIGDSRLGSMETGTGLTRALIAAVEHKCDLINMSYGEPTLLPDYGRFVDLVNEVVNKHRLIFVSSAGNNGPALTTVGAPGGTSSSIIGVGAYVSPAMAAGAHLLVEPPTEGLEYTWSSRGPTVDGDLGVSISAPGGAVAPVPTWTLQRRMLMNGTSMSSPSACGGVALIVSAMKAEGIPVSPYTVRKALENTSIPIGALPEEKLTAGQGLMQVDKAYDYMQKVQNLPCVWYQVKIKQAGITSKPTSSATSRGIYLREPLYCHQSTEVRLMLLFLTLLYDSIPDIFGIAFGTKGHAKSCRFCRVSRPKKIQIERFIKTIYAADSLSCKPWKSGQIERRFIEVPFGATWVEATMRTYGFDTARRFFIDTVQLSPLQRPIKWESVATFSSPSSKNFVFRVEGGQTMELAIAQFWSSGIGSHETTIVDFEIAFRGIKISKEEVVLDGSEAPVRIDAEALLSTEKLVPSAVLNKIRVPYRHCCFAFLFFQFTLQSEYPKYTPLLAKILEGVLSRSNIEDKFHHFTEIISAADEVIASIDRDELAKCCALRSDPEDEATEKLKKKMETTRDQLTEALYQKGLALAELEALKGESTVDKVDMFEENFKELKKWVDLKSSKYGILSVFRERHHGRLGTALKVLNDMIQDDGNPPKKKFYELKLSLLDQIGWSHLVAYEKQWMQVRFPSSLPLF